MTFSFEARFECWRLQGEVLSLYGGVHLASTRGIALAVAVLGSRAGSCRGVGGKPAKRLCSTRRDQSRRHGPHPPRCVDDGYPAAYNAY